MNLPIRKLFLASIIALVGIAMPSALARDILVNGDFHDGKTHWQGDGDAPDVGGKLVITLKPDKWTAVRQTFTAGSKHLQLKITYSYSSDCSLAVKRADSDPAIAPFTAHDLEQATGLANHIGDVSMYSDTAWMALVVNNGWTRRRCMVDLKPDETDPRVFTSEISQSDKFFENTLCLAFPPGKGTVTITHVELIGSEDN